MPALSIHPFFILFCLVTKNRSNGFRATRLVVTTLLYAYICIYLNFHAGLSMRGTEPLHTNLREHAVSLLNAQKHFQKIFDQTVQYCERNHTGLVHLSNSSITLLCSTTNKLRTENKQRSKRP